ncbi:transposase [Rhizobium sp. SEMIA 4085]|uniref:Uncharacterized protein n=1 Tax=Rhizobium gallicum bv. gallicum R602sp TaxID=1041138 RepID=A0A0B4X436_9HYPH|nr:MULTISPECIES: hypothetical protein [Rhizobium]AJD41273.1 hypothetical protein RGR602_CH01942 [Rhizobium gallicum bv. gallicum R602sp]NNH33873.1 transposase [Rhizobium sp. SEMIA 4085]
MTVKEEMERKFGRQTLERPVKAGELFDVVDALTATILSLRARIEALESGGIKYAGTWQRALPYRKGMVVTSAGAMWTALADTPEGIAPGSNAAFWQLSQKSKPTKRVKAEGRQHDDVQP